MTSDPAPISVIGLGPMGQTMTRCLLKAGHEVVVWNRTPSRAEGVVAEGARLAATPGEALTAGELVLLSLTDYRAMDEILDGSEAELSGRTLINVSSDSPARTREAAEWAAGHGARLLVGGLMVPAPMLGTEAAFAYYSGPRADFDKAREVLALIAEPRYLGADPGLAQLMYQAHLDVFLTTLSALMHATALVGSAGVSAREFLPEVWPTVTGIPAMLSAGGDLGAEIDAGEHPGHLSTAAMMGATTDHIVAASEDAGIDLTLPHAVQGHYHRALADGHGTENWSRIIDGIRTPR